MSEVSNMCIDLVLVQSPNGENDAKGDSYESNKTFKEEAEESLLGSEIWLQSKIEELRVQNSEFKAKLFHLEQIVVPRNTQESQQLLSRIAEQERELFLSKGLYSDTLNQLEVAKKSLKRVNKQNGDLQKQLTSLQSQNMELYSSRSLKDLQLCFDKQSRELEELRKLSSETELDIKNQLTQLQSSVNANELELKKVKVECSKLTKDKFELCEKQLKTEIMLKDLTDKNHAHEAELIEKNGEINSMKSEFKKLLKCNNDVLKTLMGQSDTIDESSTLDNKIDTIASTESKKVTNPESNTNLNTVKASQSRMTRSASTANPRKRRWEKKQSFKPFSCQHANCLKSYSHPGSLRQHERSAHNVVLRKRRKMGRLAGDD